MLNIIDEHLQRLPVDALDNIRRGCAKLEHPLQDLFLVHHVTRIDLPELVSVERQCRQSRKIVFLLDSFVRYFYEIDLLLLALVVDILELLQNLLAFLVTFFVCKQPVQCIVYLSIDCQSRARLSRRTEKDDDVVVFVEDVLQHLSVDLLNFPRYFQGILVGDPGQHFVFVVEIAGVDQRVLISEEREGRESLDAVFLRHAGVLRGDEYNSRLVQLVVDVLQIVEDIVALFSFVATSACHNFGSIISNELRKMLLIINPIAI